MAIFSQIIGRGRNVAANVTERGQLVSGPLDFSKFYNALADTANVAVEVIPPIQNKDFVITSIVLYANKNVGAADATVELFQTSASNANSGVNIINQEMLKQTTLVLPNLNILVNEGNWIKLVTDDDDVFVNLSGYYTPHV